MDDFLIYDWLQRFALWRCRKLDWHPQRYRQATGFNGLSMHARCGRCGMVGLVDSQGNLFAARSEDSDG